MHMCAKYPRADQLRLLFTDTDSLAYAVQTDNIYRGMDDDAASRYGFSEYPLYHPLYDTSNRSAYARICWTASKMLRFLCTGKVDKNISAHL